MNKDILVGSHALTYRAITVRENNHYDIDLVTLDKPTYSSPNGKKIEYLMNQDLYNLLLPHTSPIDGTNLLVPDVNTLYLLKLSHMNQNINWNKHWLDIQRLQPYLKHPLNQELFNSLYAFWVKFYPLKPIKLDKTMEEFFNQVTPEEHEFHHHWFKFSDKPVYESFLKDNHDVMINMDKFFNLSKTDQFNSLWEESMVIAFERKLPLLKGIQKVLCDLSKGKWNQFMIWNLVEIMKHYPQMNTRFIRLSNSLQEHKLENPVVKTV